MLLYIFIITFELLYNNEFTIMYGVIEFAGHGISKGGFDNGNKINEPLLCISM